jgi:hypothetical protein
MSSQSYVQWSTSENFGSCEEIQNMEHAAFLKENQFSQRRVGNVAWETWNVVKISEKEKLGALLRQNWVREV